MQLELKNLYNNNSQLFNKTLHYHMLCNMVIYNSQVIQLVNSKVMDQASLENYSDTLKTKFKTQHQQEMKIQEWSSYYGYKTKLQELELLLILLHMNNMFTKLNSKMNTSQT